MVSQHFCPRPYRSARDDARSRSAAHRRGSVRTARGAGATGRGSGALQVGGTFVQYAHPAVSTSPLSCSDQRLRGRDRHGTVDIGEIRETE